ncbi:adenylate kinase [Phytophthora citrophthora]|uniref:Adenylate kinase n=1 Tax=Phytophthora citrophthora TaxID=4793 RepID=A0AAD9LDK1_9STRA|nr:adenylate kinase [Phytophthora citrophthora]
MEFADEASVELLPAPDPSTRRKLFGLTHAGALIETSQVTLCAETKTEESASSHGTLAGFASFDDQIPAGLARWPEVRDYLKKRLLFGKANGCLLLLAFRYDSSVASERNILAVLLNQLFKLRPELGGVVLAVHVGVDVEELGAFSQTFSCYDAVGLSTGGLLMFYRALRSDYSPSVYIRRPLSTETEMDQLQAMVKKNEESKRHQNWFDPATDPSRLLSNQDEHRACFVSQCVDTQQPCGLLACTDSIDTDQVDKYARLFSDIYHKSNPIVQDAPASIPEPVPSNNAMPPPPGARASIAPAPPTPLQANSLKTLARMAGGPPNIVVLGPTGAGKRTQSKRLVREFGIVYVCTGDLLREAASDLSGKYGDLDRFMAIGDLVPDDIIQELVLNRLSQMDCKSRGWLLEGFPRTDTQARVLVSHGVKPDVVAILELSDDDATQRDEGDESSAPVGRRLAQYREHREAVRQNFVKISTIIHVDAAKSRDTMTKKLVHEIYRARGSRGPLRVRNPPRLIITGAPASGKGTQCELLVRALHVVHLSTGDILRQAIRDGSSLGKQAQGFMDDGKLVPDELIVDVVLERLAQPDCKTRGWLLDGFPRTEAQAKALQAATIIPDCVLALDVPDDEVVKRIAGRRLDPETGKTYHVEFNPPPAEIADRVIQRSDDTEETVRTRLEQFHAHSKAVVTALAGVCELIQADGTKPVDQVAEQLLGGTERCLLRNNVVIISLFSMSPTYQSCASLFLANVFEHFKDKDCVLLCLPENCTRPAITSGFRFVRGDSTVSTVARMKQQDEENAAATRKKHKLDKTKLSVLYVFHREELPFLVNLTLDLSTNDEVQEHIEPVIVKGMGVKGFSLTVKSWTHKWFELLGLGGKKEKKIQPQTEERPRAVTSETGTSANTDDHTDEGRNTIH